MPYFSPVPVIVNHLADVGNQLGYWANQNVGVAESEQQARERAAQQGAQYQWQNMSLARNEEDDAYRRAIDERNFGAGLAAQQAAAKERAYQFGTTMDYQRARDEENRKIYEEGLKSREAIDAANNAARAAQAAGKISGLDESTKQMQLLGLRAGLAKIAADPMKKSLLANPTQRAATLGAIEAEVAAKTKSPLRPDVYFDPGKMDYVVNPNVFTGEQSGPRGPYGAVSDVNYSFAPPPAAPAPTSTGTAAPAPKFTEGQRLRQGGKVYVVRGGIPVEE